MLLPTRCASRCWRPSCAKGRRPLSRAAELLDDSPGNMSWHLQTLAKYGFIEEAGGGRGRSRPWRIVDVTFSFESGQG